MDMTGTNMSYFLSEYYERHHDTGGCSGRGAGRGAAAAVGFTPPVAKKAKLHEDPDFVQGG